MELVKQWAASLDDYVIDLAWSPAGDYLAVASAAGPIVVFGGRDGSNRASFEGHEGGTNVLAWSAPGLVSGGQDGRIVWRDVVANQDSHTFAFERAWVEHLAWRPHKSASTEHPVLLAAAAGRNLRLLRPDGSLHHAFPIAPKSISALAWSPSGRLLAVAYFGGVCLWDADSLTAFKEFGYSNSIHKLAWSADGKWLVSGNQDPSVHLWIPESGFEFHMSGYEGKVQEVCFDHTGRWLATSGGSEGCVWDCQGNGPEGREPAMLPHEAKLCAVAFQNGHGLLATGSEDGMVRLWSPERSNPLRATIKLPSKVSRIVWSGDDTFLAVGAASGVTYVFGVK